MALTLLFNRHTKPSAEVLAEVLRAHTDVSLVRIGKPLPMGDYVVNWGCTRVGGGYADLNHQENVRKAVNKLEALKYLKENGVNVPTFSELAPELKLPLIGRTNRHAKGRGLWVCRTWEGANRAISEGAEHFLELIEDALEFRVHVFKFNHRYRSMKLSEKVEGRGVVKNYRNGWRFVYPYHWEEAKLARRAAKSAVKALELDFGAVDVIVKNGETYVLEVNTAPSLTDTNSDTLSRYAQKILLRYKQGLEDPSDRYYRHGDEAEADCSECCWSCQMCPCDGDC